MLSLSLKQCSLATSRQKFGILQKQLDWKQGLLDPELHPNPNQPASYSAQITKYPQQTKVERPPASNYYDSGQNVQQHSPQQPLAWQPDKDPCSCSETPNGARYSTAQRLKELENSEEFDMVVDVVCRLKT